MELRNGRSNEDWARYDRIKWIIALLLAALLAILWFLGYGPGGKSCATCAAGGAAAPVAAAASVALAAAVAPAAACSVGMDAKAGKVSITGNVKDEPTKKALMDAATVSYGAGNIADLTKIDGGAGLCAWSGKANDLFAWLKTKGDAGLNVNGDAVTLTGLVASQPVKDELGAWATTYFGANTKVDNQLRIAAAKPPAVKVYFETGKSNIDAKDRDAIGTIIGYVKANPGSKAVISGFHDARGNKASNELLAKNRAKAVRDILRSAQLTDEMIDMRQPQETTGSGDLKEARRVEVSVE
jgi:outer membrane protein OmpA-like peptidoglycan-associated protein